MMPRRLRAETAEATDHEGEQVESAGTHGVEATKTPRRKSKETCRDLFLHSADNGCFGIPGNVRLNSEPNIIEGRIMAAWQGVPLPLLSTNWKEEL